jgi:hypothetical protein
MWDRTGRGRIEYETAVHHEARRQRDAAAIAAFPDGRLLVGEPTIRFMEPATGADLRRDFQLELRLARVECR